MLINMEKHIEWASLWALVISIVLVGILQDWVIGQVKRVVCPYV